MNRSLHFKIVLILVIFIVCIMSIVGAIMLNSVFGFYNDRFAAQMESGITPTLLTELQTAMEGDNYAEKQKEIIVRGFTGALGIDSYRNFYILDMNGGFLAGSNDELGEKLIKTPNMLKGMKGEVGGSQILGADYMDHAVPLKSADGELGCLLYIKDSQEEMRSFSWMLFTIIIQTLLLGVTVAIILSFFLAKAITSPIQSLTKGAAKLADGQFNQRITVHSSDELGMLTHTFNDMARIIKNNLAEISGEREKLSTIFLFLDDGVMAFAADGTLLHINPLAQKILGEPLADAGFAELIKHLDINIDEDKIRDEGERSVIFSDVVCNDRILDITFCTFRYTLEDIDYEGIITVMHDITGRYQLEQSRREFIANVSHELRTPLTSIKGATETILENFDIDRADQERFLNIIINESDRMTRIVKDLLVLSRLENKRMQWKYELVRMDSICRQIYDAMQVESAERQHTFKLDIQNKIPKTCADKERIEQVLVNILSNAMKYTPSGGKVKMTLRSDEACIYMSVKDNGRGILEDDLPRLFERFYRVEKARSSETGGTGLGLAIAKEIVSAHDGTIEIASVYGEGSEVTVKLPIRDSVVIEVEG